MLLFTYRDCCRLIQLEKLQKGRKGENLATLYNDYDIARFLILIMRKFLVTKHYFSQFKFYVLPHKSCSSETIKSQNRIERLKSRPVLRLITLT